MKWNSYLYLGSWLNNWIFSPCDMVVHGDAKTTQNQAEPLPHRRTDNSTMKLLCWVNTCRFIMAKQALISKEWWIRTIEWGLGDGAVLSLHNINTARITNKRSWEFDQGKVSPSTLIHHLHLMALFNAWVSWYSYQNDENSLKSLKINSELHF